MISDTVQIMEVNLFTPYYESMQIPIIDAAVRYDFPYNMYSYILLIRNALHVPSIFINTLSPFMLREVGIEVRERPKIQVKNPTVDDKSIYFPETGF